MRKRYKLLCIIIVVIVLIWAAINIVEAVQYYKIKQYAQKIPEPFYTLVVDGKIIQHPYTVHFDRMTWTEDGFVGREDGRAEIPLLTVLCAMGAECTEMDNAVVHIEYRDAEYFLVPQRQGLYTADAFRSLSSSGDLPDSQETWNERNLLLLSNGDADSCPREECGEYIVQLGHLHMLTMYMGFTFTFDEELGIVFFSSKIEQSIGEPKPAH